MNTLQIILCAAGLVFIAACNRLPEASFEASPNPVDVGDTVYFQNTSRYADTYEWDFRDGFGSTEEHPLHSFASAGQYEVQLTAINSAGSDSASVPVFIHLSYKCWSKLADLLTPRQSHMVVLLDNAIYVGGGVHSGTTFEAYDISMDTWKSKADLPYRAEFPAGCVLDGKIYFMGGFVSNPAYDSLYVYDPATNKWEQKSSMPTKRHDHAALIIDGKIYVVGGASDFPLTEPHTSVEIYDPVEDSWITKTGTGTGFTFRWGFGACVVNDKIYTIGGIHATENPPEGENVLAMNIVEEYDPLTNIWTRKTSMPTARYGVAAVALDNKIFVIGGYPDSPPTTHIRIVEVYDVETDTWEELGSMPKGLGWIEAVEQDGIIFIPGGGGLSPAIEYDCFYTYDPACETENN